MLESNQRSLTSTAKQKFRKEIEYMSKVKLLVVEGSGTNNSPYIGGTERIIDLDITVPENENIVEIIRYNFDANGSGERRVSDDIQPIVTLSHINGLVGKVLTIIDATLADPEQRKATKDLMKDMIYSWYMSQGDMFTDTWRKDKFPDYATAFDREASDRVIKTDAHGNR